MVSSISLGNFYQSGGRTVVGGAGGSGLDTESIIKGLVEARGLNVKTLQDKVDANTKKATALSEFRALATKLKDASDLLRNVPGFNKASGNAFSYVTGTIASNTTVAGDTYVSLSVEPGTRVQNFTIDEVISVAKAKKQRTGDFTVATADTAVTATVAGPNEFKAGTIVVNGQNITLENGDSLNRIASKFNAVATQSGISANVIKLDENQFRLIFTATETGTDADFDLTAPATVSDPSGVLTNILPGIALVDAAANASFKIDNQTIIRQTNTVNDAIAGVTFTIKQATPALTTLSGKISPDATTAKNAIIGFINAYNDIKIFQSKQTEIGQDGTYADTAVLANSSTLRSTTGALGTEVSSIISGLSGTITRLGDIGVTFTDLQATDEAPLTRNVLTLDEGKLDGKLTSNFDDVRKLFEFNLSSANPNLAVFSRTNALGVSNFTLTIDPAAVPSPLFTATYDLGAGPVTINMTTTAFGSGTGYRLEGPANTPLAGLVMLYSSSAAATINVTATQGVGDRVYNYVNDILEDTSGAISVEQEALQTNTDKLNTDISRLNDQLETYRRQLLDQFGRLEQAISQVNTILQTLDAQAQARANN